MAAVTLFPLFCGKNKNHCFKRDSCIGMLWLLLLFFGNLENRDVLMNAEDTEKICARCRHGIHTDLP